MALLPAVSLYFLVTLQEGLHFRLRALVPVSMGTQASEGAAVCSMTKLISILKRPQWFLKLLLAFVHQTSNT
jgi:hypothetical protein